MFYYKVVLLSVVSIPFCWSLLEEKISVNTPLGLIEGTVMNSWKNESFYAFRGIPYAKPTTGINRFRPSVPIESWIGVLDATKDGYICPQYNPKIDSSLISENCLILNVFTKNVNGSASVLVYIHGGMFLFGGSHSKIFWGPQYLMEKNIVFITINYRLGPLGFLNSESLDAPGNLAFKDQVIALQWVKKNVKSFGGDPNRVTLWGHSSGAICVTLHLISPMSQGLFHRAIIMSASSTSHFQSRNKESTKELATKLGCPTHSSQLLVDCLRNISYEIIMDAMNSIGTSEFHKLRWYYDVEKNFGQERFLLDHPIRSYLHGKFTRVPILAGIVKDEFTALAYEIYNDSKLLDEFNSNFHTAASTTLEYKLDEVHISNLLRKSYLRDQKITWNNMKQFGDIFSDLLANHGMHVLAILANNYTDFYYYRNDFQGRYSWKYGNDGKPIGVYHADDLLYLLVHTEKAPMFKKTDLESQMVEKLTELWTTFGKNGDPNNYTNSWTKDINWMPFKKCCKKVLFINQNSTFDEEPFQERFSLLDNIFSYLKTP